MTVIQKPSVFTARTQHAHDGFSYSGMWATLVSRLPATQNYDRTIPHTAGSRAKWLGRLWGLKNSWLLDYVRPYAASHISRLFPAPDRRVSASRASRVSKQYSITAQTRSSWSNATDTITNIGIASVPVVWVGYLRDQMPPIRSRRSESQASLVSPQNIRLQNRLDLRDRMRMIRSRTSESQASLVSEHNIQLHNRFDIRDQMRPIRSRTSESQASLVSEQNIDYRIDSIFVIKCDRYDHKHRNHKHLYRFSIQNTYLVPKTYKILK